MAIGLGKILGFDFEENFNFPYIAKSIKEFWRRWHISLSSWFRDYLYIPLGGSRLGSKRTYINLFIVFLCTGFWHGASWSFIFWGLFHGAFLMLERAGFDKVLAKTYKPVQHLYTLLLVIIGWVFFRVEEFGDALSYLGRMFGISEQPIDFVWLDYMNNYKTLVLVIGLLFCVNLTKGWAWLESKTGNFAKHKIYIEIKTWSALVLILILFFFSSSEIANNTYNPFIYFRF
jgi:alginate O-acetyltransferase complex protein AlgI